jgi:hypothetical protein
MLHISLPALTKLFPSCAKDSLRRQQNLLANKDQMVEDQKQIYQNVS